MPATAKPWRLSLVRHGQSTWNALGRAQGQTVAPPLTDLGRQQARALGQHFEPAPATRLLSSDLVRAVQTADAIAAFIGVRPQLDRRLREQGYGRFEGRLSSELARLDVDWTDPGVRIGGGESMDDVHARIGSLLTDLLAAAREDPRPIVLVTHGDTIRAALAWLRGHGSDRVTPAVAPNASITEITLADGVVRQERVVVPGQGVGRR
jgi:probable phosphoglycerate mutase